MSLIVLNYVSNMKNTFRPFSKREPIAEREKRMRYVERQSNRDRDRETEERHARDRDDCVYEPEREERERYEARQRETKRGYTTA